MVRYLHPNQGNHYRSSFAAFTVKYLSLSGRHCFRIILRRNTTVFAWNRHFSFRSSNVFAWSDLLYSLSWVQCRWSPPSTAILFIKPAKFSLGWPLFAHFDRRKEQWEYLHRNRLPCQRQDTWMSHIHGISCAPRTNTLWKFNDTISSLTSSLSSMRSCVVISISITEEQQHHFRAMPGWSEEIVAARTNLWQYADDRPTNRDEEHNKNSLLPLLSQSHPPDLFILPKLQTISNGVA